MPESQPTRIATGEFTIHVRLGGVPRDGLRGAAREGCCTNPVRVGRRVRSREPGRDRTRGDPDTRTSGGHGPCPTELLASACHLSQVQASALPQRKHLGRKHAGQALRFGGSAARASVAKGGGGGEVHSPATLSRVLLCCRHDTPCGTVGSAASRHSPHPGTATASGIATTPRLRHSAVSAARAGMGPWGCSSTILAARRRVHLQHRSLSTGASRQQPELDAPTSSRIGGHAHAHRDKRC